MLASCVTPMFAGVIVQPSASRSAPRPASHQPHSSSGLMASAPLPTTVRTLWPPASRRLTIAAGLTHSGAEEQPAEDATVKVKLMLAESSGRLDLSECSLDAVPPGVFEVPDLEELSLAGNQLTSLPPEVGRLTALKRLQLAGNRLEGLPDTVGALTALEGLWVHGNMLASLPPSLSALSRLTQLSLAGNRLRQLDPSLGALAALQELSLAGNRIEQLPESLGQLAALTKLSLHGNALATLPAAVSGLQALEELSLQGNPPLAELPAQLGELPRLKHLSAADCGLQAVPAELGRLPALQSLSLYGCQLREVAPAILQAPQLKQLWLEGNPLAPAAVEALLEAVPAAPSLRILGLDSSQLGGASAAAVQAAGGRLQAGRVHGSGAGYFKVDEAKGGGGEAHRARALVVSFGSAPGTPNWGGVLSKVRAAAGSAAEADFDVVYIVDPHRAWYCGGDEGFQAYESRLRSLTEQYERVVLIGDSMGGTAALLFSHLATCVHAFTPQTCLESASIRPAQPPAWFDALRERLLANVAASAADIRVHVGSWAHDLDQARVLPPQHVHCQIYSVDSHRLALYLDRRGKLEALVRAAILQELGLPSGNVRLANLV